MPFSKIIRTDSIPAPLFSELDNREACLWISDDRQNVQDLASTVEVAGLPWWQVYSELNSEDFLRQIRVSEDISEPMVRLRGLKHIVADNPNDITLPARALPIFLLSGSPGTPNTGFAAKSRRQAMLVGLFRAPIRTLVILGTPSENSIKELVDLWDEGFRPTILIVSENDDAKAVLEAISNRAAPKAHSLINISIKSFARQISSQYISPRSGAKILRVRNAKKNTVKLDVTRLDDPQRPILGKYDTIFDIDLYPIQETDLLQQEIEDFFKDVRTSWRPFAAGMPFQADERALRHAIRALEGMERDKDEFLRIRYISSENGAGATTLLRSICWEAASKGFPVLIARNTPFEPDPDDVADYINRINILLSETQGNSTLHEVPWIVAFDQGLWEGREDELATFVRRVEKTGRQVLVIVAVGPYLPMPFYNEKRFEKIADLSHIITSTNAEALGSHLNRFLRRIGAEKTMEQWRHFLRETTSHSDTSLASFWVALSFWLQGRFNLQETFDTWIYRQFCENISDSEVIDSIIKMSALAAERTSMPSIFLPPTTDFPVSEKLSDARLDAPSLGIVSIGDDLGRYWTILHQSVAEALLNGFYFDYDLRSKAGYERAKNPTHLSMLILKDIAHDERLATKHLRDLAEQFPTQIFKIDPDHGHAIFTPYWQEVLEALSEMPDVFKRTSRTFLHHTAISRRRIASDKDRFPINVEARIRLLERATVDINAALLIAADDNTEPDLNLYNSLARAYYDLAAVQLDAGADRDVVMETQRRAAEATRRAYSLNPDSPYVTETYAENLIVEAKGDPDNASKYALEVLTLVYANLEDNELSKRHRALNKIADRAFDLLLNSTMNTPANPSNQTEAILVALRPLAEFEDRYDDMELSDYPYELRVEVAQRLSAPILRDNPQAVKLHYIFACLDRPYDFELQLSLLLALGDVEEIVTPQMLLEKAVLFYQTGRPFDGDKMFEHLRRLWKRRTYFVEVPRRLHWLLDPDSEVRRQVQAKVVDRGEFRSFAIVDEFGGAKAAFRPREFAESGAVLGGRFSALVSFGHNGPLLRPLTAR